MKKIASLALIASLAFFSGSFLTAETGDSPCKDLKKTQCVKKSGCCWVKGHEQKGKKVQGYCRKCSK